MSEPKLSIITINFNDVNGLQKTMDSVFEQSFQDLEYILIDGGSDDGSLDLIEQNEERIAYSMSEKDYGVFHAQNKGIKVAKGQYLLFLNSGDILNGNRALEDFITHKDFHGDIIYGDYKFEDGEKIYPDELTPYYFMRTSLPHQSTFFKKKVFDDMGLYDEKFKIAADRAFYIKCFMSGTIQFQHIKYPLTQFDLSGVSNDPGLLKEKEAEDEAVFREYFGMHYEDLKERREAEKELYHAKRNTLTGILKRIKKRLSL
jgi:glycosyltransferase involved in cell wall biosynthesis